jgi:hypothetical protein
MQIEIGSETFQRLQKLARPLIDRPDDVITRLLNSYQGSAIDSEIESGELAEASFPIQAVPAHPARFLKGLQRELWELVIKKIHRSIFTLTDVYQGLQPIRELRPDVIELEASVRGALERLRDKEFVDFIDNRGTYRIGRAGRVELGSTNGSGG